MRLSRAQDAQPVKPLTAASGRQKIEVSFLGIFRANTFEDAGTSYEFLSQKGKHGSPGCWEKVQPMLKTKYAEPWLQRIGFWVRLRASRTGELGFKDARRGGRWELL